MKFQCHCGSTIHDAGDNLPNKAHLIPDQVWETFWTAIDAAIETSGPTARQKEAACMALRTKFRSTKIWQCPECSRLYVDTGSSELQCFAPATPEAAKEILRSR